MATKGPFMAFGAILGPYGGLDTDKIEEKKGVPIAPISHRRLRKTTITVSEVKLRTSENV